jgi:predicted Zn-ribbon and HTH transcriptional regulator
MALPEGREIAYQCENAHVNTSHISQPAGHDMKAVCRECKSQLTRVLVPVRECQNCGNEWAYLGDSDRPTCPECKGKRTVPVAEQSAD